jgi:hypothetical protein
MSIRKAVKGSSWKTSEKGLLPHKWQNAKYPCTLVAENKDPRGIARKCLRKGGEPVGLKKRLGRFT